MNPKKLLKDIFDKKEYISVIGLGYVGIHSAYAFSKLAKVVGFDLDKDKISLYKKGIDPTGEIGDKGIGECSVEFTYDETKLSLAKLHIVAVPTPVKEDKTPDPYLVKNASKILGKYLTKGSIVVFESTVYPGMTEEECIPILEETSGLEYKKDFFVAYSPERINPGDKVNTFENIKKIVSACDEGTLDAVAQLYESVITAGVHRAPSIKVAEAAKVIENTQRDINIGFMNEISIIFDKMGIDTKSVLEAAGTKWNFLKFSPGLVGGQCIGVDPYYLIHKGKQNGVDCKIMSAVREVNDYMGRHVGEKTVLLLAQAGIDVKNAKVAVFGLTFKENCPDVRNSRVYEIVDELKKYGISPLVYDPVALDEDAKKHYCISLCEKENLFDLDALIVAVSHKEFLEYNAEKINSMFKNGKKVLIDVKGIFSSAEFEKYGFVYWRL